MAIPFRSLRCRAGGAQVWGVNIRRTVRWKNQESFVARMPANQVSVILQISLGGIDAPSGSRKLEIKPYGISSVATDRRATPAIASGGAADAGFDVRYGLTQNLTADFTYNTDFGAGRGRRAAEYHPGSELFLVYTDERDTEPGGLPPLRNRALVVKINRLMRF